MPDDFSRYVPYSFVPLAIKSVQTNENLATDHVSTRLEAPVWHHGTNPNQKDLFIGELRCTLTAVTPLLVGNEHVSFGQLNQTLKQQINPTCRSYAVRDPADQKTIIYPLRLSGVDGQPVLIPSESLKGAFRHVLGSLMSTPLERVSEATFSSRPNADINFRNPGRSIPIAAKVVESDAAKLLLRVQPIFSSDLCFVHGEHAYTQLESCRVEAPDGSYSIGPLFPQLADQFPWYVFNSGQGKNRRSRVKEGLPTYDIGEGPSDFGINKACELFRYQSGIDDGRLLMARFRPAIAIPHLGVLVCKEYIANYILTVSPAIVAQYHATQDHVVDKVSGHLSRHPHDTTDVKKMGPIQAGDLIFCEMLLPMDVTRQHALELAADPSAAAKIKNEAAILSFGHNFRYRWKSADSVCNVLDDFDATKKEWKVSRRPETTACADEKPDGNGKPKKLSAERRMHGFVTQKSNEAFDDLNDLEDPFNRLAGRISFNFAMERVDDHPAEADRFVSASAMGNTDKLPDHVVFLQPLAAGKYFFKSYVPQKKDQPSVSWGDGILMNADGKGFQVQSRTPAFSGRKHYPHQLGTLQVLPRCHFDMAAVWERAPHNAKTEQPTVLHNGKVRTIKGFAFDWPDFLVNNQASAARYVSKEGTEFGYVVRYKDLDAVELGALLACIDPQGFANWLRQDAEHKLGETKRWLAENTNATFALKLGHGRPLGMGSVVNNIDQIVSWDNEKPVDEQQKNKCFAKLCEHLDDAVVKQWFQVLQLNRADPPKSYLLAHIGAESTLLEMVKEIKTAHIRAMRTNPVFGKSISVNS